MLYLRELFITVCTKNILNALLMHYSDICSLLFAEKNITMHKLCDIYLYHPRCLFVYLSLELHNSKVIEKFIVFINIQKFLSVWSLAVLLGLSSPLYFFFFLSHRWFQKCKYARLYLPSYSPEVVSQDIK